MTHATPRAAPAAAPTSTPVLSLGETPLANALLAPSGSTSPSRRTRSTSRSARPARSCRSPRRCRRRCCSATTSTSRRSPTRCCAHAERARRAARSPSASSAPDSLVVEVASNDGYLLQYYRAARRPGARHRAGPEHRARWREERGIPTSREFFGAELAARLAAEGTRADVFHANNVLAHVADLNGFVAGHRTSCSKPTASR